MGVLDQRTASKTKTVHLAPAAGQTVHVTDVILDVSGVGNVVLDGFHNGTPCGSASWGNGQGTGEWPLDLTLSGDAGDTLSFQASVDGAVVVTIEGNAA